MPAEIASRLEIGVSKSYRNNGMTLKRNNQSSKLYEESDVMALQRMITLIKEHSITVENVAFIRATSD